MVEKWQLYYSVTVWSMDNVDEVRHCVTSLTIYLHKNKSSSYPVLKAKRDTERRVEFIWTVWLEKFTLVFYLGQNADRKSQKNILLGYIEIKTLLYLPWPKSNKFSDWKRTCHALWVEANSLLPRETTSWTFDSHACDQVLHLETAAREFSVPVGPI